MDAIRSAAGCLLALVFASACGSTPEVVSLADVSAGPPASRPLPLGAQALSLTGQALYPPPLSAGERAKRELALSEAQRAWEVAPHDADATLWLGRRLGYLGRFQEALDVFSIGASEHPDDARFLRHRGHRLISVREFERAAADLERAAALVANRPDEIEPDGQPNARGVPLETLKSNIFYHLGLAHFLRGDFERALPAYRECLKFAANPDNQCSATHWLYITLRRLGREDEAAQVAAAIRADLDIVEYHSYHQLCLAYRGERDMDELWAAARAKGVESTDFATVGFGAGEWHLYNGRSDRAAAIFREVLCSPQWHAFGFIASEAESSRL